MYNKFIAYSSVKHKRFYLKYISFKSSHHICTKHKIFKNLKMDKK